MNKLDSCSSEAGETQDVFQIICILVGWRPSQLESKKRLGICIHLGAVTWCHDFKVLSCIREFKASCFGARRMEACNLRVLPDTCRHAGLFMKYEVTQAEEET